MIEPIAKMTVETALPTNRKKPPRAAFSAIPTRLSEDILAQSAFEIGHVCHYLTGDRKVGGFSSLIARKVISLSVRVARRRTRKPQPRSSACPSHPVACQKEGSHNEKRAPEAILVWSTVLQSYRARPIVRRRTLSEPTPAAALTTICSSPQPV